LLVAAICACDLRSGRQPLNLLFGIHWSGCITALDVLLVMFLQNKGFRPSRLVVTLIVPSARVSLRKSFLQTQRCGSARRLRPKFELSPIRRAFHRHGILGATVMPHNLYLHSSIVQTRKYEPTPEGKREAIKFATIDSTVALMFALFINAAILIVSAATFHGTTHEVAEIQDAHKLLSPVLGVSIASTLFAVALLASGRTPRLPARSRDRS
jgi:manganese transport protein